MAFGYVPMVAMVGGWFARSRTAALGVAVSGIGLGNLVATYGSAELIDAHGWRTTYRTYAVLGAVLLLVAAVCVERPPRPAVAAASPGAGRGGPHAALPGHVPVHAGHVPGPLHPLRVPALLRQGPRHLVGSRLRCWWASSVAAPSSAAWSSGPWGARLGVVRLYQLCFGTMGATFLLWLLSGGHYAVLLLFAVTFGISYGGFIALAPAVAAEVFGTAGLGGVLGALYTAAGLGGIGLFIGGEVIDAQDSYTAAIVGSLVLVVASTVILAPLGRYTRAAHG